MDTLRHWGWVMGQTDLPPSASDQLIWDLTALATFLIIVAVILGVSVRVLWKNR